MRLILNAGGSNEGVKRNRSYKWDYFMSMNKSKKILNEWLFRIFYGASRGIRTRVKTLAYVALLDAKTALLLGFSFP